MTTTTDTVRLDQLEAGEGFRWQTALLAFLFTLLLVAVVAASFLLAFSRLQDGRVLPGVSVGGVAVAGLERQAAEARLREELPPLGDGSVLLTVGDQTSAVGFQTIGREYDLAGALDAAFAVGRGRSGLPGAVDALMTLTSPTSIDVGVGYDAAAVAQVAASAAASAERPATDASFALATDGSGWEVTPSVPGETIASAEIESGIAAALEASRSTAPEVSLATLSVEPALTTQEVESSIAQAEAISGRGLTLEANAERLTIPASTVRGWLTVTPDADGSAAVEVSTTPIRSAILGFSEGVAQPAENARLRFGEGNAVIVEPGSDGQELDVEASVAAAQQALTSGPEGSDPVAQLVLATVPADFTTEEARAVAPRMTKISAWRTGFINSERNGFGANINVPTGIIDGYFLAPGEEFDFWAAVGEVTRERGYKTGAAIINGRTEPRGALAGGICSCSTTLFNAALRAGLEMGDRRNHYYYITRYPVGLDATVFKSGRSVQNMTFTNDTEYPILIRGIQGHSVVKFQLYSVDGGRTVTFSEPIIQNRRPAEDKVEYAEERPDGTPLRPGERYRVEYPTTGFQVWVTRYVRDAQGTLIHKDTYYSRYARITGLTLVGVGAGSPDAGEEVPLEDEG